MSFTNTKRMTAALLACLLICTGVGFLAAPAAGLAAFVCGLLTGGDLIRGLQNEDCAAVLITVCMLRDGENVFLDDMTLEEVSRALGKPVIPVGRRGDELLQAIVEASKWQGR